MTFLEANGVPATIERVGRRYIDTQGKVWRGESGEWSDKTIVILGGRSNSYSSWVRTKFGSEPDLRSATLTFSYSGHDANGNPFSGSVTAKLASGQATASQPTAALAPVSEIPEGMGAFVVVNWYGQTMKVTINNKVYDVGASGASTTIFLPPGNYTYSANWEGGGFYQGSVDVKLGGKFTMTFRE